MIKKLARWILREEIQVINEKHLISLNEVSLHYINQINHYKNFINASMKESNK